MPDDPNDMEHFMRALTMAISEGLGILDFYEIAERQRSARDIYRAVNELAQTTTHTIQ